MTNAILREKPDAGNPHARFDEGASASEEPRRNALLHIYILTRSMSFYGWHLFAPQISLTQ